MEPNARFAAVLVTAVVLMSAITAGEGAVYRAASARPIEWPSLIGLRLLDWSTCALWVPFIYLIVIRTRFGRSFWLRTLPALFAATVAAAVLKYVIYVPLEGWVDPSRMRSVGDSLRSDFLAKLMFYWAVTGLLYAYAMATGELRLAAAPGNNSHGKPETRPVLMLRSSKRTELVAPPMVDWVCADENYCRVSVEGSTRLVRRTLASMEAELAPHGIVRVHRSILVNAERVARLESSNRELRLILSDGTSFQVGRKYRAAVRQMLALRHR
jgi:hypothetical protein